MSTTFDDITGLISQNNLEEAQRRIQQLGGDGEDRVLKHHLEGRLHERQHDWDAALAAYQAVLEVDEDHRETLFRLAYMLDLRGDDEEAMELYERCIADTPAPINAVMNLAVLYEDHGRFSEALDLIQGVLEEHPNHIRAGIFAKDMESSLTMYYDEEREATREKRDAILDTPVSDFELSVRSRNCLKQMNIHSLGDLLRITEPKLLAYKNFGETSLNEIKAMLSQKGLRLGQSLDEPQVQPTASGAAASPVITAGDPNLLNRSVAELELSVRSRKCLQRLGISSLGELVQRSEPELLSIKNFGQTSLSEIKRRLGEVGLSLAEPQH